MPGTYRVKKIRQRKISRLQTPDGRTSRAMLTARQVFRCNPRVLEPRETLLSITYGSAAQFLK